MSCFQLFSVVMYFELFVLMFNLCMYGCAPLCASARGSQKNTLGPRNVELQMGVSCPLWGLGSGPLQGLETMCIYF